MEYLRSGQNCGIADTSLTVMCSWRRWGAVDADLSAILLDSGRRVRGDADFVFYNQPSSVDDAVRHVGKRAGDDRVEDRISIELASVAHDVQMVAVVVSVDGDPAATVASLANLDIAILDAADRPVVGFRMPTLTTETAVVCVEVYRRDAGWKVRAVGQGYQDGLAGLARDFGVTVDDEPTAPAPQPAALGAPVIDWTNPPVPAGYEL
ncbi:TerD family protein [Antrihabitans spumae]|uniref:TerD family protein n=1 Tax=Antrihabitans spumae TaxID=3373370 RepID=A0ABW7KGI6_9NOCA